MRDAIFGALTRLMVPLGEVIRPTESYEHKGMPELVAGRAAVTGVVLARHSLHPMPVRHRRMTVEEAKQFADNPDVRVNSEDKQEGTVDLLFENENDWTGSVGLGLRYTEGEHHVYQVVTLEGDQANMRNPLKISSSIGYAAAGSTVKWLPYLEPIAPTSAETLMVPYGADRLHMYGLRTEDIV
jgi:hypothetical protein